MLYAIAHPEMSPDDRRWIEGLRRAHCPTDAARIAAHFTLAFGTRAIAERVYLAHVAEIAAAVPPFAFRCRRLEAGRDHATAEGYAYLVPDAGAEKLTALHARLCTGPLAPLLRENVPYVPHITVGRCADFDAATRLCARLGETRFEISGVVRTLTVVAADGEAVAPRAQFALGG